MDARRSISRLVVPCIQGLSVLTLLTSALDANKATADEGSEPPAQYCFAPSGAACSYYMVSIAALVANAALYDGRKVLVAGYLHLEFEGNAIYLHEDDYKHNIFRNGLWVSWSNDTALPDKRTCPSDHYVQVQGTFSAKQTGHMSLWSGSIRDITRCFETGQRRVHRSWFVHRLEYEADITKRRGRPRIWVDAP
jgi:hypothetical protein